ncbi:tetratricopeptide repeat protein [Muricoccus radiodurans]|uniref:CHAT domain-containing tetratricopeptide repeat protein n=1 Tax=Muricoccus radiodurans TaxID=2231721 RepID=UPI003CF78EA9
MELVEISEDRSRPCGALLRVDGYVFPTAIAPPAVEETEDELDWYFEQHLNFPFTDKIRARTAAASLTTYGEALFRQLVASDDAREAYGKLKERAYPDRLQFAVIGSPAFQALHWEALKDPRLPRPFALDAPILRRGVAASPVLEAYPAESPTLNLVVVTARPGEASDVGYRTITRPLVGTLRQAQLRVVVDIVRPGTWQALAEHLEDATQRHGAGHYHAIHFDLHGGLLNYDEFEGTAQQVQAGDVTFGGRWGRGEIAAYEGVKAFLMFERPIGVGADLAEAGEVTSLLLKHKIPIAVLNACQSGKQVGAQETSLGSRLLEAGAQSVIAMAWSVTVSAAERLIPVFYGQLFKGQALSEALLVGRRALHADKSRRAAFNEVIELEDWILPVVYQNREPRFRNREFTPAEARCWFSKQDSRTSEPETEYGFFGRDLDLLRIEKALLVRQNILLVRGMGGSGKSTLLRHLAYWWELTGLTERTFYFGWDERAWTRNQIVRELGRHVLSKDLWVIFDSMTEGAQQQAVAGELRARRQLIILDNLESVTAAPLAIPHSLDAQQRRDLHSFLKELIGGQTLVLLGSRGDEAWLAPGTFGDNVHQLEGLDPQAASALADAVLRRANAQARTKESAFRELLRLLAGYPLALQVVLPNLTRKSASDVLVELRQGLAELDVPLGTDSSLSRTRSLMGCIDYSHGHLDPEAQVLLLCFAPFAGVFDLDFLEGFQQELSREPALFGLHLDRLGAILEETRQLGLSQRDPSDPMVMHLQPALGWFLHTRLKTEEASERREAIERAFCRFYGDVALSIFRAQRSGNPEHQLAARAIVEREYANLGTALQLAIKYRELVAPHYAALSHYLADTHDHTRALELGTLVLTELEQVPHENLQESTAAEIVGVLEDLVTTQRSLRLFDQAVQTSEKALFFLERITSLKPTLVAIGRASIRHQLGLIRQEQELFSEAEAHYRTAATIRLENGQVRAAADTQHQLGRLARLQGKLDVARIEYQKALEIYEGLKEWVEAADVYHNLGVVEQIAEQFSTAETFYRKALPIWEASGKQLRAAATYHQLGMLAHKQRQFRKAEEYYKYALGIKLSRKDAYGAASTYHELGSLAADQGRTSEAANLYGKALRIYTASGDKKNHSRVFHNLCLLWRQRGDAAMLAALSDALGIRPAEVRNLLSGCGG